MMTEKNSQKADELYSKSPISQSNSHAHIFNIMKQTTAAFFRFIFNAF